MARRKLDSSDFSAKRRSPRVFEQSNLWYFLTREGTRGPFPDRTSAQRELIAYVATLRYIEEERSDLLQDIDTEDVEIIEMEIPRFCGGGGPARN